MPKILLCPGIDPQYPRYPDRSRPLELWSLVNNHLNLVIMMRSEKRSEWIREGTSNLDIREDGIRVFLSRWRTDTIRGLPRTPPAEYTLTPLQECVYDIAWEVSTDHSFPSGPWVITTPFLGGIGETRNLELLRSAALYQAAHDDVSD
jgi:hypothetical protein